jgi:hypothetical protein
MAGWWRNQETAKRTVSLGDTITLDLGDLGKMIAGDRSVPDTWRQLQQRRYMRLRMRFSATKKHNEGGSVGSAPPRATLR